MWRIHIILYSPGNPLPPRPPPNPGGKRAIYNDGNTTFNKYTPLRGRVHSFLFLRSLLYVVSSRKFGAHSDRLPKLVGRLFFTRIASDKCVRVPKKESVFNVIDNTFSIIVPIFRTKNSIFTAIRISYRIYILYID